MRRALFVVDDRPEAGRGHVVRCGALADELRERGWECHVCTLDASGDGRHYDVVVMDANQNSPRRYRRTAYIPDTFKLVKVIDNLGENLSDVDLLVCGSAGATPEMFKDSGAKRVFAGPEYALLRPEFRRHREQMEIIWAHLSMVEPGVLDLRCVSGKSAGELATLIYGAIVHQDRILSYGGMTATEIGCIVGAGFGTEWGIEPRNDGEHLNAVGLTQGRYPDGLGVQRVADAIEEMF